MIKLLQSFVLHILANMAGLYLIDYAVVNFCIVSDTTTTTCPPEAAVNWYALVIGAVVLALVNAVIKPILKLVSLPFVFLSMGLFMFVINAIVLGLMIWAVNTMQVTGVHFLIPADPVMTYLYAAVILGLFNLATHWLTKVR